MGCSMGWTGGMPCEAWMKTVDQTYRKTTFLTVLSNTYPPSTGCSMGWDRWDVDVVQSLNENS
jgi:hypothetical protein